MTPKEKAEELVKKYAKQLYFSEEIKVDEINITEANLEEPIQCALIAVDEMIEERKRFGYHDCAVHQKKRMDYLNEVKQEIENL